MTETTGLRELNSTPVPRRRRRVFSLFFGGFQKRAIFKGLLFYFIFVAFRSFGSVRGSPTVRKI